MFPDLVMYRGKNKHMHIEVGTFLFRVAESQMLGNVVVRDRFGVEHTVRRAWVRRTRAQDFMRRLL